MWIVTKGGGFVSLVQHQEDPDTIRARARRREHLVATFKLEDHEVIDLGDKAPDYRWHANIPREQAAEAVWNSVWEIDFESHCKEEFAPPSDPVFYSALMSCWGALYRLQDPSRPAWGYPRDTKADELDLMSDDEWDAWVAERDRLDEAVSS